MDRQTKISQITADMVAKHGPRTVRAFVEAMMEEAGKDAFTCQNGDVQIIKRDVMSRARADMVFQHQLRELFLQAWPDVKDYITYEKRQQWSDAREEERILAEVVQE